MRLRKLVLDGREFVWTADIRHVRGERDCHRCVRVRVWGAGKNSRVLQADLLSNAWGLPWGCATDVAHPTPRDVRALIEFALADGWDPDTVGGTHLLTEQAAFELPDFLLTDRRHDPTATDPTARVIQVSEKVGDF